MGRTISLCRQGPTSFAHLGLRGETWAGLEVPFCGLSRVPRFPGFYLMYHPDIINAIHTPIFMGFPLTSPVQTLPFFRSPPPS